MTAAAAAPVETVAAADFARQDLGCCCCCCWPCSARERVGDDDARAHRGDGDSDDAPADPPRDEDGPAAAGCLTDGCGDDDDGETATLGTC